MTPKRVQGSIILFSAQAKRRMRAKRAMHKLKGTIMSYYNVQSSLQSLALRLTRGQDYMPGVILHAKASHWRPIVSKQGDLATFAFSSCFALFFAWSSWSFSGDTWPPSVKALCGAGFRPPEGGVFPRRWPNSCCWASCTFAGVSRRWPSALDSDGFFSKLATLDLCCTSW